MDDVLYQDEAWHPSAFAPSLKRREAGLVNEVFAKVARRYDQMNDLMSGGLHRLWKDDLVAMLNPPRNARPFEVLDVAGGTGDIASASLKAWRAAATAVTLADISPECCEVAAGG